MKNDSNIIEGVVWIAECDHKPIIIHGKLVSFPYTENGAMALMNYLNTFPTDDGHYYDGVQYQRVVR